MDLNTLKINRTVIPFSKFKCEGFTPHEEFEKKAYSILEDIIGKIPGDAQFTAECKKRFGKYYFKIAVNGSNVSFEARTVVDAHQETSARDWLDKAIEGLHDSMDVQLKSWLQSRQLNC